MRTLAGRRFAFIIAGNTLAARPMTSGCIHPASHVVLMIKPLVSTKPRAAAWTRMPEVAMCISVPVGGKTIGVQLHLTKLRQSARACEIAGEVFHPRWI
jgi:hypothetical protein